MTVFLQLRDAAADALLAAPAVADGNVRRGGRRPMPHEVSRWVVVRLAVADGEAAGILGGPTDWRTSLQVEIHARDEDDPEAVVDAMLGEVFQRLAPLQAPGLGVMQALELPNVEWDHGESDTGHVCAILTARIVHRTAGTNLTAWS